MIFEKMSGYLPNFWNDIITVLKDRYEEGDDTVVILGAYLTTPISYFREKYKDKKLVIYQTEPLSHQHWWPESVILTRLKQVDEIWEENADRAHRLRTMGFNVEFKPLRWCEELQRIESKEKPEIDVLFFGTITPYRGEVLAKALNKYTNLVAVYNIDGQALDDLIANSKIVLNLNTHADLSDQKHARLFYLLINSKCVVSEPAKTNVYGDLIVETKDILNTTWGLLRDGSWRNHTVNLSEKYRSLCVSMYG
jgi:hypothetical protein